MDKHDRRALKTALTLCRNESVYRAQQLDAKLADEPWEDVARFAAWCCQTRALRLDPWRTPPCNGDSVHHPDPEARKLLRQMLDLGGRRWHPDPMEAIAEAKKRKAA